MTLAKLKRIEIITTIVITILLLPYALMAGWLMGSIFIDSWQGRWETFLYIMQIMFGIVAITFAPTLLLTIRKITKKNSATIIVFFVTLPFTSLLFGLFLVSIPLTIITVGLAGASQGYGGRIWPMGLHIGLSILVGTIFSLFLSLLANVYITYKIKIIQSKENQR